MDCKYFKKCGGCDYANITYDDYLSKKKNYATKILKDVTAVSSITGMKNPYHYRNKIHAAFGIQDKMVVCGTYKKNSHDIVEHEECLIEDETADKIIMTIKRLLKDFKIKIYDEDTEYGLVRHVLIRKGVYTGQILVTIVCTDPIFPSKNNFMKALLREHKEITSIVLNINDRRTSQILGNKNIVLYGKGYIEDKIFDKTYRISANSFYQVNSYMVEKLYGRAIELAFTNRKNDEKKSNKLINADIVLDLYCGIGTIGISASKYAKQVLGVEINKDAVKDAIINAKLNNLKNIRFVNEDATAFMNQVILEERELKEKTRVDVAFIDPPREGCDRDFIISLIELSPSKIVYISCNPETLARDLKIFAKKYDIGKVDLFDMFPWTSHVESVVLLCLKTKKKPKR